MSGATADPRLAPSRAAPKKRMQLSWSDPRLRNLVWQVLIIGAVVGGIWWLAANASANLAARRIATGFGFLERNAGIPIGEHLIPYESASSTYARALLVGVLNTLKAAVVGIVLATILGTLVGIARLSNNWLVAKISAVYVEVLRDLPLLLQLLFWYSLKQVLPLPREPWHPLPGVYLSNRGITVPTLDMETAHWWAVAAFALGLAGTIAWRRQAARKQEETGVRPPVWPVALGLLVALPLAVWAALGAPAGIDLPKPGRFNFTGGATLSPEYGALLLGLVLYTAAYIAEIVRSGILSVPQGQWEAAGALGLRRGAALRQIVLPQAMRVIIPPMTSQYLNLTKNSSLAVAIGYQDVYSIVNTAQNQTGQAVEGVALLMAVYLFFSLSTSLFMNWYNARIALVER